MKLFAVQYGIKLFFLYWTFPYRKILKRKDHKFLVKIFYDFFIHRLNKIEKLMQAVDLQTHQKNAIAKQTRKTY